MTDDFVALRGMIFYGYHGNRPEEKTLGQRFEVDVVARTDLARSGASDDLSETIDYGLIHAEVRKVVEGPSLNLLEAVAQRIGDAVLSLSDRIDRVEVVVRKPSVPLPGSLAGAEVRIVRGRGPS